MPDSPGAERPILIRNGYVVPGAHRPHLDRADILVEANRIGAIGGDLLSQEAVGRRNPRVIDAAKRIVIPGFINAHTHSNESFCQGFWDALPLEVWILHKYPPFALTPLPERTHYLRTMLLAIECLRSGITTVQDMLGLTPLNEDHTDVVLSAYRESGIRVVFSPMVADVPAIAMVRVAQRAVVSGTMPIPTLHSTSRQTASKLRSCTRSRSGWPARAALSARKRCRALARSSPTKS